MDKMTDEELAEFEALRSEFELSSLGDRPQSMAAEKINRLVELEGMVRAAAESPRVTLAREELRRAGWYDENADYGGQIGPGVLQLVTVFAGQGHSGASAPLTAYLFNMLVMGKPLTDLTNDPDEWIDRTEECDGEPTWQNRRCASVFSKDGGQTWYDLEEERSEGNAPTPQGNLPRILGSLEARAMRSAQQRRRKNRKK